MRTWNLRATFGMTMMPHQAVDRVLDELGVTQLRPLLLAIFKQFKPDQTAKALPMIVAWTVRFLICGSGAVARLRRLTPTARRGVVGQSEHGASFMGDDEGDRPR